MKKKMKNTHTIYYYSIFKDSHADIDTLINEI